MATWRYKSRFLPISHSKFIDLMEQFQRAILQYNELGSCKYLIASKPFDVRWEGRADIRKNIGKHHWSLTSGFNIEFYESGKPHTKESFLGSIHFNKKSNPREIEFQIRETILEATNHHELPLTTLSHPFKLGLLTVISAKISPLLEPKRLSI